MAAISCDVCGGSLSMDVSGNFALCESCGMKHTKERMKAKAQEITGTVEVRNLSSIEPFMKRGRLALEDKQWYDATKYFDKALDIDPEHAPAYVGKLCADVSVRTWRYSTLELEIKNDIFAYIVKKEADLARYYKPLDDMPNYQKAIRFADKSYKAQLEGYNLEIKKRIEGLKKEFTFYMIIEDSTDYPVYEDYKRKERIGTKTSISGTCCIGNLNDGLAFRIQRTGLIYSVKENYIYDTKDGDIKTGDVAIITHESDFVNMWRDMNNIVRILHENTKPGENHERFLKRYEQWKAAGKPKHLTF